MGRWEPDSRGRLQEAALVLYSEQGFDRTTAAQIAKRAGVTERTFFRHFADKREVLFGGSALLRERIVAAVASAPAPDGPLDAVSRGLDAAAAFLGDSRRDLAEKRHAVIVANPELRERELAKLADYATAVAVALRDRSVSEPQATLAAEAGMTVLRVAMERWASGEDGRDLATIMRDSVAELRAVCDRRVLLEPVDLSTGAGSGPTGHLRSQQGRTHRHSSIEEVSDDRDRR